MTDQIRAIKIEKVKVTEREGKKENNIHIYIHIYIYIYIYIYPNKINMKDGTCVSADKFSDNDVSKNFKLKHSKITQ